jgi:hypothetical protein
LEVRVGSETVDVKTGEIVETKSIAPIPVSNATAIAAAESARALVQARVVMAVQRPRDIDEVRRRLLNECKRPRFAEAARYARPMGETKARGWSIRFAEAAVRAMGNISISATQIAEDDDSIVIQFEAIDLETNASFGGQTRLRKIAERRRLRDGEVALAVRTNSKGEPTYVVRATEDDLTTKIASFTSKGIRTYAMRHVPADILEECLDVINSGPKEDPTLARKRIVDAYAAIGIGPDDVKKIAGVKDLSLLRPDQLQHLREVYVGLKDGDVSLEDVLENVEAKSNDLKDKVKAAAEASKQ